MKYKNYFDMVCGLFGGVVTYLLGGFDTALQVILLFMILDYITGIIASALNGGLNSEVGAKGLAKKAGIIIMIILGSLLDRLTMNDEFIFRNVVIFFFIANEGISITENLGRIGLPIPEKIKNVLEQLKEEKESE